MPFVHPGLVGAALLAGLVPVVVHLINRRRHRRVPWAAMRFLLAANRRSATRIRLEHWLLLLLRVVVMVLLGLALARPFVSASGLISLRPTRVHRVLLVDNSLSMQAQAAHAGESRFDVALRSAMRLVQTFPETDPVSLITLSAPSSAVIASPAYDRRFVRERLGGIRPTQRGTDVAGAVTLTREILRDTDVAAGNQAVYLLTDLATGPWSISPTGVASPAMLALRQLVDDLRDPADLTVVAVGQGEADNVAVTQFGTDTTLVGLHLPVGLFAEVTNYGQATARDWTLQLRREGQIVRRQTLPAIEPGQSTLTAMTTEFTRPGVHALEARVVAPTADALELDDARYFSLEVRPSTPVLLVDGRPGSTPLAGQAGFLSMALSPRTEVSPDRVSSGATPMARPSPLAPRVIADTELPDEPLIDHDVVVLCNVGRLSNTDWERITDYVREGGGLMVFGGDLVSPEHYNRLGHADGGGVLPVRFLSTAAPSEPQSFLSSGLSDPMVAEFERHPSSGLFLARVDRYLPVEPDPRAEIVLRYANGDPALIAGSFGAGRVLVFTTTASMDWNNLPARGDYVSLMFNAVTHLSRARGGHRNLMVGQTLHERLNAREVAMAPRVIAPDGSTQEPALVPDGATLAATFGPIEQSGLWTLGIGTDLRMAAVNVDPIESQLRTVDRNAFLSGEGGLNRPVRFVEGESALSDEPTAARSTELSSLLLYAVLALLLLEMGAATWFSNPRGESAAPMESALGAHR